MTAQGTVGTRGRVPTSILLADAVRLGEDTREAAWLRVLVEPDRRGELVAVDERWETLLRMLQPEFETLVEQQLDSLVERDPVAAVELSRSLRGYRARDASYHRTAVERCVADYRRIARSETAGPSILEREATALDQQALAARWSERLSVIEYGEAGEQPWLLGAEYDRCLALRTSAARVLAHIDYIALHPGGLPNSAMLALVDEAAAVEREIERWSEEALVARVARGRRER